MFEASEFSNAVFSSAPTEISAGGSVNADSLSKCTSGCLSNAACQAVSWTRQSQGVKNICRFYKAPDWGNQIVGTVELHTAKVVIMGRCENVAHYLHPNGQWRGGVGVERTADEERVALQIREALAAVYGTTLSPIGPKEP